LTPSTPATSTQMSVRWGSSGRNSGGGGNVGTGPPATVFCPWGCLRKARATWDHVGQVLWAENVPPRIAVKLYKAVVQAVLLYGSKTWVLSKTALASLEGLHIRVAYPMAVRHKPRRGPGHGWIYPKLKDVLEECGMSTLTKYIIVCWQTIAVYVVIRPILTKCRQDKQKRGAVPHRWW
jgi:hypothetical protein